MTIITETAPARRGKLVEVHRDFTWVSPLREAAGGAQLDDEHRRARVIIITEGLGNLRDKNYYTAEAIQSCLPVFESAQMFVDHPSTIDDETRPERSMHELAGYFSEPSLGTVTDPETGEQLAACFATVNCSNAEPGRLAYEQIKTAIEQQRLYPGTKNVYCGISINGNGSSHPGTIRGMAVNMVTAIREAFSADIVTKPARGGRFLTLMQESQQFVTQLGGRTAQGAQKGSAQRHAAHPRTTEGSRMKKTQQGRVITRESEAEIEARKAHLMTDEGMKGFAGKLGRLAAIRAGGEAEAAPGDADELQKDIIMDVAALKAIAAGPDDGGGDGGDGSGAAQDEEEARRRAAEEEARRRAGEGEGSRRAGESEEEAETRRRAAEDAEARRRAGEGEGARRTDESEEEAEARRRKEAEDEEEVARRAAEQDMGMTGEDEAGPKMAFTCEGCGAETEVLAPKGYRLVATESWKRAAESLRAARQREAALTGRLTGKEARFVRTNESHVQDSKQVLRENADLRRENTSLKAILDAQRVLRENQIPRDILKWEVLAKHPRALWQDRIDQALRTKAMEAKILSGGNRERSAGGGMRETQTGTLDVAASFDKHFKAQG